MKLSHIAAAAALALGTASSFAIDLGTLNLTSGSAGFFSTPVIGNFTDTLTFSVTAPLGTIANGSVTSVVNGNQDVDFSSITVTGPSGSFSFFPQLLDPVEVWALPAAGALLFPGTYTITFAGLNSAGGASYGGNFAVTPIPEPETLALMLAGLGAVGFVARRRKF